MQAWERVLRSCEAVWLTGKSVVSRQTIGIEESTAREPRCLRPLRKAWVSVKFAGHSYIFCACRLFFKHCLPFISLHFNYLSICKFLFHIPSFQPPPPLQVVTVFHSSIFYIHGRRCIAKRG
jgi:hypothetical protein